MEDDNKISGENQHKFEEWLANHFPNIETFVNKNRRAKLYGTHVNKREELKSCIHFIQVQQRKSMQKEKEFLKLKQSQLVESHKIQKFFWEHHDLVAKECKEMQAKINKEKDFNLKKSI